jgi:hypothetical protein
MEKISPLPQTPDSATLTPQQLAEMATHPEWFVRLDAARHPSTSPETLSQMPGDPAMAQHPNISLSTLGHLAESADSSVAQEARAVLLERLEQARERGFECER